MTDIATLAQKEILDLHAFFVKWFRGEVEKTEANFAHLRLRFLPQFVIYFPSGYICSLEDFLTMVYNNHSGRKPVGEAYNIFIDQFLVRWKSVDEQTVLCTYEERQIVKDVEEYIRLSSAWFIRDNNAPNGVQWLHIHESWKKGFGPK